MTTLPEINPHVKLLKSLRNAEHFDLMEYVDVTVAATGIKPAGLVPVWNTYHLAFGKEDIIYKRASKNDDTARIVTTHHRRKKDSIAIRHLLEAASYSPAPAVKEAADLLLELMANYKSANSAPMNEASALYTNLLQDFAKTAQAAALALIPGGAEAVAQLETDNETFKTLYRERAQGEEDVKEEGTLLDARKATDLAFVDLAGSINAFYRVNEILGPSKDQEVSDTLHTLIHDINAYLHQHELTYARRNPKYHADADKPSTPTEPGEDIPGDEDLPEEPAIPEFSISAQETLGNSTVMTGYGTQMSLRAVDPQAFADVLYPGARDALLHLTWPSSGNGDTFPVADFLFDTDGTTPIGLVADAPEGWAIYKPFTGSGEVIAEIFKDDQLLAILLNVQFPAMMGED